MISIAGAIILIGFGEVSAISCIMVGTVLHMRYLDRKLNKPIVKAPAQIQTKGTP